MKDRIEKEKVEERKDNAEINNEEEKVVDKDLKIERLSH